LIREEGKMIDVTALTYSDAVKYREDYLSTNPIYNVTDEEFYTITSTYGFDCLGKQISRRFRI
jgi:hypothetical protein